MKFKNRKDAAEALDAVIAEADSIDTGATLITSFEQIIAAIDTVLSNTYETPEEMAADVAKIRDAVNALVTVADSEAIQTEAEASTEEGKALHAVIAKAVGSLEKAVNGYKSFNEIKIKAANDRAKLADLSKGLPSPFVAPTDGTKSMQTITARKRSKTFTDDKTAYQMGQFVKSQMGDNRAAQYCNDHGIKAMTASNDASAGLFIPEQLEDAIIKLRDERGLARKVCKVVPMSSDSVKRRRQVSGPSFTYIGEGSTIATTGKVVYETYDLNSKWVATGTEFYTNLEEDATINLIDEFTDWAGYALAGAEDAAIFAGDGTSTYGGIIGMRQKFKNLVEGAGGTWTTDAHKLYAAGLSSAGGDLWTDVTAAIVQKMGAYVANRVGANRAYICSSQFYYNVLYPLALASNTVTPVDIIDGVQTFRFNGYPVYITDYMPTATAVSTIPLLFGDFSSYAFGDRRGMTVEFDKNITTQLTQAVVTARYGGMAEDFGNASSTAADRVRGGVAGIVTDNS